MKRVRIKHAPGRILSGDLPDVPTCIVGELESLTRAVRHAGQERAAITARNAVAVQVFHVVEHAVTTEGACQAVSLTQHKRVAAQGSERGVVARLSEVFADGAAVGLEYALRPCRAENSHRGVGGHIERVLPVVRPPSAQRTKLESLRNWLREDARKDQWEPRRCDGRIRRAGQRADWT